MRIKYPRTPHLPWSPGATSDDIYQGNTRYFENKVVVVTEKMDGENTSIYRDFVHARSIDSRFHPSRTWVKALQAEIGYKIPEGWRICGENLYARHSIVYEELTSYFMAFSAWNEKNECLSWENSKRLFEQLGLATPTELYVGNWCEKTIKNILLDTKKQEGYVVRIADSFHFKDFSKSIAKWVRNNHVVTDKHWMHAEVIPNTLSSDGPLQKKEVKMKNLASWIESLALTHAPNFDECVSFLGNYFPLLHQFAETEQDKIWHAEGDVAIHTDMVLSELYNLLAAEAQHIVGRKRQVLILSALLHDIAKPLTTRRKGINGFERVVASKHEEIGASYLATKLIELPLEHESIMSIMGLVGFHQVPKLLVVRNKSYSDYFHLSLNADLELLYWLELADMKGRVCDDLEKQVDLLEQFRMFAEDYQLWRVVNPTQPILNKIQVKSSVTEQVFIDAYTVHQLAHGQISVAEEAIAKNYEPCQNYSHLYLMCGISGSGKSTWIEKNLPEFEVISLDEIRAELNGKRDCQKNRGQVLQLAKARLKNALANKRNVVWDATNIRRDFRKIICDLGFNYGALITIVAFQVRESSLRLNNRNRKHAVGEDVVTNQINKLEWPNFTEAHRLIVIGEKGREFLKQGSFN